MKLLTNLNMVQNQILNAVIQNLASAPGSPVEGLTYYDTTLHQLGIYSSGS